MFEFINTVFDSSSALAGLVASSPWAAGTWVVKLMVVGCFLDCAVCGVLSLQQPSKSASHPTTWLPDIVTYELATIIWGSRVTSMMIMIMSCEIVRCQGFYRDTRLTSDRYDVLFICA